MGTRAPLGVFSLRKTLPLPDGGMLSVQDAGLAARLPPQLPAAADGGRRTVGHARAAWRWLAPWVGSRTMIGLIGIARALRRLQRGRSLPPPDPEGEARIPLVAEPSPAVTAPIAVADPAREAHRRRGLYLQCAELARRLGARPVFDALPDGLVPYGLPFRADEEAAARFEAALGRLGLLSLPWPDLPTGLDASAHYRDVSLVHFMW